MIALVRKEDFDSIAMMAIAMMPPPPTIMAIATALPRLLMAAAAPAMTWLPLNVVIVDNDRGDSPSSYRARALRAGAQEVSRVRDCAFRDTVAAPAAAGAASSASTSPRFALGLNVPLHKGMAKGWNHCIKEWPKATKRQQGPGRLFPDPLLPKPRLGVV